MGDDDHTPRSWRDAAATRLKLLIAARTLFLQHGKDAVGLRAIAAQAGVDVMLIRRYFGGKQQLFDEATAFGDHLAGQWQRDLPEIVDWLLRVTTTDDLERHPTLFALLRSSGDPAVTERVNQRVDEVVTRPLAARIELPDAELRADLVCAMVIGLGVMRTVLGKDPLCGATAEELREPLTEVLTTLTGGAPAQCRCACSPGGA
ncbi:AcrR family transcriptional regulator [Kutzneria viridogrisea]|uniref:AcrR family transcriptional regulator n=1 Tax=Kutzneria viridogrisea TaxID=47990 RepID=A0ABR6B8N3_9PSEU|nr:TetR family transcriptional regulator [Kutzneria albida]MBA8923213.1 AcrR family transcriptional regulator [Kutzneria viridogrisea]